MKKRGVGVSVGFYGTAAMGGGDPSCALVKLQSDGSLAVLLGVTDIGQGCKTVLAQIAAEELGIPYEQVTVVNGDTDVSPFCLGTMGSRVTYVAGNSVRLAAQQLRGKLFELAAPLLNAPLDALVIEDGHISVSGDTQPGIPLARLAKMNPLIVGQGNFVPPPKPKDPNTGKWMPYNTFTFGCVWAEVEVDTQTGVVKLTRLVCTYDAGKAINPMMVEGQIEGGAAMSQGQAMLEVLHPYYPTLDWQPTTLGGYLVPTAVDVPEIECEIYECPSAEGPYGAKGIGEITAIVPPAAIASAICDAVGVWIHEMPITPEKILRALEAS